MRNIGMGENLGIDPAQFKQHLCVKEQNLRKSA